MLAAFDWTLSSWQQFIEMLLVNRKAPQHQIQNPIKSRTSMKPFARDGRK